MKLTKRRAMQILFLGMAGSILGQDKLKFAEPFKIQPNNLIVDGEYVKGIVLRLNGKEKTFTMQEIWDAL
jgi:hypothetical protein